MSVLAQRHAAGHLSGPRRLDPSTDLIGVASLIEEAFAEELDREGKQILDDLRQISRLGPLLWVLKQIGTGFDDLMSGFVWDEDGQIIGNVSVSPIGQVFSNWRISNVAVRIPYRNRGIAKQLMHTAIDYVLYRGGRTVYLQVRDDNQPAIHVYQNLGFQTVTAETELYLSAAKTTIQPTALQARALRPQEGTEVYFLAVDSIPASDQRLNPLQKLDFELDWLQRISETLTALISKQRTYRFVVDGKDGLAGYISVVTARRHAGVHRMRLLVRPAYEGKVESALIRAALGALAQLSPAETQIKLNAGKKQEIEALQSFGFIKRRTLATMELSLGR
jgi:ribosomal protein S18 acetylase RimI-like enzyme